LTALHTDIDEALFDWLPLHMAENAVVIIYFSGQAWVTPAGDVLLAPYDGSPSATARLYPLRDIESALARLKAKQALLLFDGMVSRLRGDAKGKTASPRWELDGGNVVGLIGGNDFTKGVEDDQHRHGLFTYYLLKGLRGDADTNRDGMVTLGETTDYVRQKVAWAAKSQFSTKQRPLLLPPLKPDNPAASLVLSKPAAIAGSETP
jgi:uncharacterized caspase-like protein